MVGNHGHATTTPEHWEKAFAFAKYNGANVDIGHFVAGNNVSPVAFIKQHHDRTTHVHLKDRKFHNGPNTPFGEGDTPIGRCCACCGITNGISRRPSSLNTRFRPVRIG